jgi:gliding motility-associated-like protein
MTVTVHPNPVPGLAQRWEGCAGSPIQLTGQPGLNYNHIWSPGDLLDDAMAVRPIFMQNQNPASSESSIINLLLEDATTGCTSERVDTVVVNGYPEVQASATDLSILSGEMATIAFTADREGVSFSWVLDSMQGLLLDEPIASGSGSEFSETLSLQETATESTRLFYTLTATHEGSECSNSLSFIILVEPIFDPDIICDRIPNILSPNGDDFNELWDPLITDGSGENPDIQVFTLNGTRVWNQPDYSGAGWNGQSESGVSCPEGPYWYIAKTSKTTCRGSLTLLR